MGRPSTLTRIFWFAGTFYFVYALSVAVFLTSPLFEKVVTFGPKNGTLKIGWGWSLFPGSVELRKVRLKIEDENMTLEVGLPKIHVQIRLLDLIRRKVTITSLTTPTDLNSGVSEHVALRTPSEKKQYIEEKRKLSPPSEPSSEAGPWKLSIENVVLKNVEELGIDEWNFKGHAKVEGGFHLTPGVVAEILHSKISVENGNVSHFARTISGEIEAEFAPFLVPHVHGNEVFRYLSARLHLNGEVEHVRFLNPLMGPSPLASFDGGSGSFKVSGSVKEGIIQPQTLFSLSSEQVILSTAKTKIVGKGEVAWNVGADEAVLNLKLKQVDIRKQSKDGQEKELLRDGVLNALLWTRDLDLVHPFRRLESITKVTTSHPLSLLRLKGFISHGFHIAQGKLTASAELSVFSGFESGEKLFRPLNPGSVKIKIRHLTVKGNSLLSGELGNVDLRTVIQPLDFDKGEMLFQASQLAASGVYFDFDKPIPKDAPGWGFEVNSRNSILELGKEGPALTADLEVHSLDSRPIMKWLHESDRISGFIYHLGEIEAKLGKTLNAAGDLEWSSFERSGSMLVKSGILSIGLRVNHSKFEYSLFPTKDWLKSRPLG